MIEATETTAVSEPEAVATGQRFNSSVTIISMVVQNDEATRDAEMSLWPVATASGSDSKDLMARARPDRIPHKRLH